MKIIISIFKLRYFLSMFSHEVIGKKEKWNNSFGILWRGIFNGGRKKKKKYGRSNVGKTIIYPRHGDGVCTTRAQKVVTTSFNQFQGNFCSISRDRSVRRDWLAARASRRGEAGKEKLKVTGTGYAFLAAPPG